MKTATYLHALIVSLLFALGWNAQAQTTLAIEDFDMGTPSWTNNIASQTFVDPSSPSEGLFIQASTNIGSGNTAYGRDLLGETGEPTLPAPYTFTFDPVTVTGYTNVTVSFDYYAFANADVGSYEVIVDGVGQGSVEWYNDPDTTPVQGTISVNIGSANTVALELTGTLNGGSDVIELDNFTVTGDLASGPLDPTSLTVVPAGSPLDPKTQIDVTYTQNGNADNVLVAINDEDVFGTPVDATPYLAGDSLPGGGTVVGVGNIAGLTASDLCPGKTYYVKAWSVDGTTTYSSGTASVSVTTNTYSLQNNDFNSWTAVDVAGDDSWFISSGGDFASANGFSGTNPEEDWLISPAFDLNSFVGETFEFDYRSNFDDTLVVGLELFWTDNYTGDPTTTTWTAFTTVNTELDTNKSTGSQTSYTSTSVDLSSISGTQVVLGFKYITGSSAQDARDWDIENPLVSGNNSGDEQITLAATPASVDEGSTLTVNLSVPTPVGSATEFCLSSNDSDASELDFPDTVTIPMGQDNVDFTVTGLTDSTVDGDQIVNLVANAGSYTVGNLDITVVDQDVPAPVGDVLFTQYYEGASNNKWLEITNVGSSPITLSGYQVAVWSNANTEVWKTSGASGNSPNYTLDLSSVTLAAGQVYVIANPSAALPYPKENADVTSNVTFFNGDDSVVLYSDPTGYLTSNIVDAIAFTDAGNEGAEKGFIRLQAVDGYNLNTGSSIEDFDGDGSEPAIWQEITIADADNAGSGDDAYLGSSSLVTSSTPTVSFTQGAVTVGEDAATVTVTVQINNPDGNGVDVDVQFDSGNSTADLFDITSYMTTSVNFPAGASDGDTQTVNVVIDDDSAMEPTEVARFILANVVTSGGAIIGTPSAIDITIQDNDTVIPDLIISEIADPNDDFTGRFVEIYNPTGATVDLSTGNWNLTRYSNGSTSGTDIPLSGSIAAGDTYVIAFTDASGPYHNSLYGVGADLESTQINGNGDDVYALYFGGGSTTGTLVDIYGVIGTDGTGEVWEYEDGRAYRDSSVTSPNDTFNASEWVIFSDDPVNTNGIANVADMTPGVHPDPGQNPDITLSASPDSFSEEAGAAASTVTVTLSQAPALYPFTVNLTSSDTGEATVPATVDVISGTTATFDIAAVTDGVFDGNQVVTITASATGYNDGTTEVTVTDVDSFTDPGNVYISQVYHATGIGFGEMWVEICVPTGETVDFTGYTLAIWSGSEREGWKTDTGTPTTIDLSSLGTNVSGPGAFLVSDGFAVQPAYATADISDFNLLFDGDDSIVLYSGPATAANLVDAVSITSTDTATDVSIVRTATGVGFDLTVGSSYASPAYSGIWSVETTANVDAAGGTDNIYLGFCDFGSAASGLAAYLAGQSGAGGEGETDDKNGDGIINRDSYIFGLENDGTTTTGAGAGRPFSQLFGNAFVDTNAPATPDDISDDRFGFVFEVPTTVPTDGEIEIYVSDTIGGTPTLLATYSGNSLVWTPANGGQVVTDPEDSNKVIIYDNQTIGASTSRFMTFETVINTMP